MEERKNMSNQVRLMNSVLTSPSRFQSFEVEGWFKCRLEINYINSSSIKSHDIKAKLLNSSQDKNQ